jgi:hypothetical protein
MQQALDGYRQLQAVLIQQRLWARTQNRFELDTQFAAIGKVCTEIHAILDGYTQIMARLRDIATYCESDSPEDLSRPPVLGDLEMKVLAKLIMLGAGSLARFSKETNQDSQIVQAAFQHLSELQLIEARGRGLRKSFRLAPAAGVTAVKAIVAHLPLSETR